jgi:hypothetical protein
MEYKEIYNTLSQVVVNDRLKNKKSGNLTFSYLPWADAEQFAYNAIDPDLIKVDQYENADGPVIAKMPGDGYMVRVVVTIAGVARGDWYPVIDYDNKVIKNPNAFDINTAMQRAKVKAFAQHGLGLYVFLGKDGPDEYNPNTGQDIPNVPPPKPEVKAPVKNTPKATVVSSTPPPATDCEPEEPEESETDPQESNLEFDFTKEEINDEYLTAFQVKLEEFKNTQEMMTWVQSIIKALGKEEQATFRTQTQQLVADRAMSFHKR